MQTPLGPEALPTLLRFSTLIPLWRAHVHLVVWLLSGWSVKQNHNLLVSHWDVFFPDAPLQPASSESVPPIVLEKREFTNTQGFLQKCLLARSFLS